MINPKIDDLRNAICAKIVGAEHAVDLMLLGVLSGGHILIQGAPGQGKTTLAKTLAAVLDASFRRIQFTPDLLPADITGYTLFDPESRETVFHPGPVFSNIVLADEINRTSPRVQSALLECMNENQVTVDGVTHQLQEPFCVIATENRHSSIGTFPLPEPQLDRFLISLEMPRPDAATQQRILEMHALGYADTTPQAVMDREELQQIIASIRDLHISENIMCYIVNLCEALHHREDIAAGPSSRAAIALMRAARTRAWLQNRDVVYPDDVKAVVPPVLRHRLIPKGRSLDVQEQNDLILSEVLESTPVPQVLAGH